MGVKAMKDYLGDGVYAHYHEGSDGITLTTEDGMSVQNEIWLDGYTIKALMRFIERCNRCNRTSSSPDNPETAK